MNTNSQNIDVNKRMRELEKVIQAAIDEAESFADRHDLSFRIYPEYGMGGIYDGEEGVWYPSSANC